MCTYYHASNLPFTIGQSYSINDFDGDATYDHANRTEEEKEINQALDEVRSIGVLSRLKCIYLFQSLVQCYAYARSNNINHIYEVRTDGTVFGPYPMTLVTTVLYCPVEIRLDIIREYWHPTRDWKVLEFLTDSIMVEREIPIENRGYNRDDFIDDRVLSHRIYNC